MTWRSDMENAPHDKPIWLYKSGKIPIGPAIGWWQGGKYPWAFLENFSPGGAEWHECEAPQIVGKQRGSVFAIRRGVEQGG